MDLHQLRVFRSAALTGGFTRAGEELHLSQSTVSLHIKELERELDCQLFLRVGKRVMLSPAGKLLLEYAEKILHDLKNAEMAMQEMNSIQRGTVRLGTGATTLIYRLPPVLAAYRRRYPQIELILETGTTEALLRKAKAQHLDLAIVMLPVSQPGLRVVPVGREELVVVIHRHAPVARKPALAPADLTEFNYILYEKHTAMQNVIDRWLDTMGVELRVTMEMENIEAVKSLVQTGLGASILPLCAVARSGVGNSLHAARVRGYPLYRELGLVSVDGEGLPNSIRQLADMITKALKAD